MPGPASLWGILRCSNLDEKWPGNAELDENDRGSPQNEEACTTALTVREEDSVETGSSDSHNMGTSRPFTAQWEIPGSNRADLTGCEKLDLDASINSWLAAGYECGRPSLVEEKEDEDEEKEEKAPNPSIENSMPIGDISDEDSPHQSTSTHPEPPIGPYTIQASPGKGQGIFASRPIAKGERILIDKPFFLVPKPYSDHKVLDAFTHLPLASRKLYMQLSCPDRPDNIYLPDVMCIFEANCFNIGDGAAIFLTATRFNHSCLPNTYYSWRESRGEIVFHAMTDVAQGEELTISYGRPFLSRRERKDEMRFYNFICGCEACQSETAFGQASEERRLEMGTLEAEIAWFQSALDEAWLVFGLIDPLTAVLRLVDLIQEEGLKGELMTPYRQAAGVLKARGKLEEAVTFARLELEEERVCLGDESEVVRATEEFVEEIEGAIVQKEEEEKEETEEKEKQKEERDEMMDTERVLYGEDIEKLDRDPDTVTQTPTPNMNATSERPQQPSDDDEDPIISSQSSSPRLVRKK